jgi:hypothetical protein
MKFYHRTNEDNWKKIQDEGVLWGIHSYRYTYLSPDRDLTSYGPVLLEVEYSPTGEYGVDNYGFNPPDGEYCWQFSVFNPIPIADVRRIM